MPIADKGKHPLGEADAKSIPGSRLSRKKWAGAKTNTSKKVRKASNPAKTYGRTHGVVEVTAIRYHRDQKLTHKEHQSYEDLKATEIKTGIPRVSDKVPVSRGLSIRKNKRDLIKLGIRLETAERVEERRMQLDSKKRDPDKLNAKLERRWKSKAAKPPVLKRRLTPDELEEIDNKISKAAEVKKQLAVKKVRPRRKVKKVVAIDHAEVLSRKAAARKKAYANRLENAAKRKASVSYQGHIRKGSLVAAA